MQPLRAGIIGAGAMAGAHTRAVRAAGHEVVAISSSSVASASRAAEQLGIKQVFESASALIAADLVDVVHVCTPNRFHLEPTEAAILAGKPVVCEKPISMTLDEADQMLALADSHGIPTAVPFIYRYYEVATGMHAQLRALAEVGGGSGQLKHIEGAYLQDWLLAPGSTNWRVDPALGGESRVFADVGIHWCDLMEFVTGHRITRLRARFSNLYADRPTEDTAEVEFGTDRGATGSVAASQVAEGHSNDLVFNFQTADAGPGATPLAFNEFDSADYQPSFDRFMVDAYASFADRVATGSDFGAETPVASAKLPTASAKLLTASPNLPTFTDGRRAASLIDAVVRSARKGEWVVPL